MSNGNNSPATVTSAAPVAALANADTVQALMQARQTTLPKRLGEPAPSPEHLNAIFASAAHAPDHGELLPWRFVQVPSQARSALGDAFAAALRQRDAKATSEQLSRARDKAFRSPVLLLVVVNLIGGDPEINAEERIFSAGCAVQNMLLMATALGFGSALTSGKAMSSMPLRTLFGLQNGQQALCFLSIGTVISPRRGRERPASSCYVETLQVPGQALGKRFDGCDPVNVW